VSSHGVRETISSFQVHRVIVLVQSLVSCISN
jgi:hypothetical protein